jgi:carboxymethylenebutenolidase
MCFDLDSHPPIPPVAGGAIDGAEVTIRAGDGAHVSAFIARSEHSAGRGIIVLPDVRGLHPFYQELALRFAEQGVDALAIDYFGRTSGIAAGERPPDFDFSHHVAATRYGSLSWDIQAAAERLRADAGVASLYAIGFCFGGRLAFMSGTMGLDLAGVLAIFGGADPVIPPDAIETFGSALGAAGVAHEMVVYPGAPHSFFDRKQDDYAQASADAWDRVLRFVGAPGPTA